MYKIVEFSHLLIKDYVLRNKHQDMVLIDATCGRGNDTIYMAELTKEFGNVFSYDIQQTALDVTQQEVKRHNLTNVTLKLDSHEFIKEDDFDLVIFNLGYLPMGDKTITTNHVVSLKAIQNLVTKMDNFEHDALIVIVLYPGHPEGLTESIIIDDYAKNLSGSRYLVTKYQNYNRSTSPFIITISKNIRRNYK